MVSPNGQKTNEIINFQFSYYNCKLEMAMHASPCIEIWPKIELNPNTENCNFVLEETGQKILCKNFVNARKYRSEMYKFSPQSVKNLYMSDHPMDLLKQGRFNSAQPIQT